jgi:hypothetical protein
MHPQFYKAAEVVPGFQQEEAVQKVLPIHKAQLLSYMKVLNVPPGLLINFHEMKVTDGISRLILPGAGQ